MATELKNSEGFGRNGWFNISFVSTWVAPSRPDRPAGRGYLDIRSKRIGKNAPITINFNSIEDISTMIDVLVELRKEMRDA